MTRSSGNSPPYSTPPLQSDLDLGFWGQLLGYFSHFLACFWAAVDFWDVATHIVLVRDKCRQFVSFSCMVSLDWWLNVILNKRFLRSTLKQNTAFLPKSILFFAKTCFFILSLWALLCFLQFLLPLKASQMLNFSVYRRTYKNTKFLWVQYVSSPFMLI